MFLKTQYLSTLSGDPEIFCESKVGLKLKRQFIPYACHTEAWREAKVQLHTIAFILRRSSPKRRIIIGKIVTFT
jgi:hypothetical protein